LVRELEVDRERDQVLLRTVVEVALDPAAVCIGSQDQPLPGRAQLLDLEAQSVEGLLRRLDVRKLQGDRPPARGLPEVVRHRTGVVKRPSIPYDGVAACLRNRLPPP
jgi:hypothetical protein